MERDGRGLRARRSTRGPFLLRDEQRAVAARALRHADAGEHARVRARQPRDDHGAARRRAASFARASEIRREVEGR